MARRLEILERSEPRDGWITIRCALNNTLVLPFQVHVSDIAHYNEQQFLDFVERQASSLIQTYGDSREQRLEPAVA